MTELEVPEPGAPLVEFLRQIPLFSELETEQLRTVCRLSKRMRVGSGTRIIDEGARGDALYVILSGELEVSKNDEGRELILATRGPGEYLGEMSLLEQRPRTATVKAIRDSEVLAIDADTFGNLLDANPMIARGLLRTVAARLRSTEGSLMQREKLASLGTLAAGLAHELNNPAAAIQRSSATLQETLVTLGHREEALAALPLSADERRAIAEIGRRLDDAVPQSPDAEEEDKLIAALEALGVDEPWDIAPAFAAFGWTADALIAAAGQLQTMHQSAVLAALGSRLAARQMVAEITRSARAVSDIVRAVKSYAYLDQAAVQTVDLRMSLEDTLMILKHKLKEGVTVMRTFAPDLPKIEAYAGELNQVWTNLIDNAVDAMGGRGTLEIGARQVGKDVEVTIADNGPGIPSEIVSRIFDPFFTTKPQGIGTGLGLHIAHNIVVNHHRGSIDVSSAPGRTVFRVMLPLALEVRPH